MEQHSGFGWEVIKALIWLGIGVILQLFDVFSFILRRIWPAIFGGDHGVIEGDRSRRTGEVVITTDVEQRAKEQILALRSRR